MIRCYLGLGSNLGSPERQLRQAFRQLQQLPKTVVTRISRLYKSAPYGVRFQPPYCNAVIEISTQLPPHHLLALCQAIEKKHHRIRKKQWGARTLDIDILLYGQIIIHDWKLKVPHPEMLKRDFVLVPLLEIAPELQLPSGETLDPFLTNCVAHVF